MHFPFNFFLLYDNIPLIVSLLMSQFKNYTTKPRETLLGLISGAFMFRLWALTSTHSLNLTWIYCVFYYHISHFQAFTLLKFRAVRAYVVQHHECFHLHVSSPNFFNGTTTFDDEIVDTVKQKQTSGSLTACPMLLFSQQFELWFWICMDCLIRMALSA